MGFWDLFRKKPVEKEKITFEELPVWLEKTIGKTNKQKNQLLNELRGHLSELIQELEKELSVLENIDVDSKKEDEKIKLVVKENLSHYLKYLEDLIIKLKEVNGGELSAEKINSAFDSFEKKSGSSFEKSTILIGKELGSVKQSVGKFFSKMNKSLKEEGVFEKSRSLSLVNDKFDEILKVKESKMDIENGLKRKDSEINSFKTKISEKEHSIKKIKGSEEYGEQEKIRKQMDLKKQELDSKINTLREGIDFKGLAGFYHSFEKEMVIVKNYKDNFKMNFEKDPQGIVKLLEESKLFNPEIKSLIEKINKMKNEISEMRFEDLGIKEIENEINKLNSKIVTIETDKLTEKKRIKKQEEKIESLKEEIKQELEKVGVDIT